MEVPLHPESAVGCILLYGKTPTTFPLRERKRGSIWEVAQTRGRPMTYLQIAYLMLAVSYLAAVAALWVGH